MTPLPPPELPPKTNREAIARIRRTVGEGAKITIVVGEPVHVILRQARTRRADLIVMGTHGRTGLARALLGSATEAVARQSSVPVLAVRGGAGAIRSILAPVNFTDYSYYGFTYAAAMAAALSASLTALHVHVDPIWSGNPQSKLRKLLAGLPPPLHAACRRQVETGESGATTGILKAGASHDLIVLVAHGKSPALDLILGTTAERVLRGAPSSVLVVPAPRRPLSVREELPTECCAAT